MLKDTECFGLGISPLRVFELRLLPANNVGQVEGSRLSLTSAQPSWTAWSTELPITPSSHGLVAILELGFSTLPALPAVLGHSTPEQSFEYSGGVAWLGTINEP